MTIERFVNRNEGGYDFRLTKDNKYLCIYFLPNLDLYMSLNDQNRIAYNENKTVDFDISSEDGIIFELFDTLYNDIITGNVFGNNSLSKKYKIDYTLRDAYRNLVDKNGSICWVSDDGIYEAMDRMKFYKIDDAYRLTFIRNDIEDECGWFKNPEAISVRFRNSGSKYDPFNCAFMRMYQNMQKLDVDLYNNPKTLTK